MNHSKLEPSRRARSITILIVQTVLLMLTIATLGQAQQSPARGFTPARTYLLADIDTIGTVIGDLMLNIPLATQPPGRGGLTAAVRLVYNSKLWDSTIQTGVGVGGLITVERLIPSLQGGWRYGYEFKPELRYRPTES